MTTAFVQPIEPGDRPSGNARGSRSPAVGRRGMIATSQTLASAAGLKALQDGGNAIDAAVTAAAVLAVIEPSMNGIGGDLLAIVGDAKANTITGLDSTGRSAYAATPEEFERRGLTAMPARGPLTVNVPGVVEGWHQLLSRFGTMPLAEAIAPAIGYARDGFPVAELMANEWLAQHAALAADPPTAAFWYQRASGEKDPLGYLGMAKLYDAGAAGLVAVPSAGTAKPLAQNTFPSTSRMPVDARNLTGISAVRGLP